MARVDDDADLLGAQVAREAVGAAEGADPHRRRPRHRTLGAAGERSDEVEAPAEPRGRRERERGRVLGAGEEEEPRHRPSKPERKASTFFGRSAVP
jgi:hypothetical protein